MNTKIYYLYRDASNYKKQNEIVLEGEYTQEDVNAILATLDDGEYFIPENIGWDCERFVEWTEDDHPYCEMDDTCFELVDEPATELQIDGQWRSMTVSEAIERFRSAAESSWTAIVI